MLARGAGFTEDDHHAWLLTTRTWLEKAFGRATHNVSWVASAGHLPVLPVKAPESQHLARRRDGLKASLTVLSRLIEELKVECDLVAVNPGSALVPVLRAPALNRDNEQPAAPATAGRAPRGTPSQGQDMCKVLFLASNPTSTDRLALDEEARDIEAKIRASTHRDAITLRTRWAVRTDDLLQALNEDHPVIVHFSGHGAGAGIVLQDSDGSSKIVKSDALKRLFTALKDNIRVVILNACETGEQASAISEVIDCVVYMEDSIGDVAARKFAASFYSAIGFGRSVRNAFDQGLTAIAIEDLGAEDAPKLLERPGVSAQDVYLVSKAPLPIKPGPGPTAGGSEQSTRAQHDGLRLSEAAWEIMRFLRDAYVKAGFPNFRVWKFTPPDQSDPIYGELRALGLVYFGGPRGGPWRLTELGVDWIMRNRAKATDARPSGSTPTPPEPTTGAVSSPTTPPLGHAIAPEGRPADRMFWDEDSTWYRVGIHRCPQGSVWANKAIAARDGGSENEAFAHASRALQAGAQAWCAWYEAFTGRAVQNVSPPPKA